MRLFIEISSFGNNRHEEKLVKTQVNENKVVPSELVSTHCAVLTKPTDWCF